MKMIALLVWRLTPQFFALPMCTFLVCAGYGYSHVWRIFFAIFRHETGNFGSALFKRANNVCGMRVAQVREQWGVTGETNGYAEFRTPVHSIADFCDRMKTSGYHYRFDQDRHQTAGIGFEITFITMHMKEIGYYEAPQWAYDEAVTNLYIQFGKRDLFVMRMGFVTMIIASILTVIGSHAMYRNLKTLKT